jgi:secreted trypsin-like serine protease
MVCRVLWVGVLAALVSGCGPATPGSEQWGQLRQDIIGGQLTQGDPAVVALAQVYQHQGAVYVASFCTGTLIGPRTVLSAGHCVDHSLDAPTGGTPSIVAVVGPDSSQPQQYRFITRQVEHPYYDTNTVSNDISVHRLESAFSGITPIPLNTTPLSSADIGRTVRHVGYGLTSPWNNGDGLKREVSYPLRRIEAKLIESGANGQQTCQGDSGGPGFMTFGGVEKVAGVVSFGDQNCAYEGWDTRVDAYASWVMTTMATWENPSCDADGQCVQGCSTPDVDCVCVADGQCSPQCPSPAMDPDCPRDCGGGDVCSTALCPTPDPDCVDTGGECSRNQDCVSRACITDGQNGWYCTEACTSPATCPFGMECSAGQCRYPLRPVKQLGQGCDLQADHCAGETVCTGGPGEATFCREECGPGSSCTEPGAVCRSGQGAVEFCQPPPPAPKTVPLAPATAGPVASGPSLVGCSGAGGGPSWMLGLLLLPWLARRRGVAAGLAAAALATAGCAPSAESAEELAGPTEYGRTHGAILGGTVVPQGQDPEVFILSMTYLGGGCSSDAQCGNAGAFCYGGRCMSQGACTATLIASRTLLTAAHCADVRMGPAGANQQVEIYATNYTNPESAPQSTWFRVTKQRIHPNWNPNSQTLSNDMGLLLLDRAPPVTPKAWNSADISGYGGRPVRSVGYGRTVGGTAQDPNPTRKRQVALSFILPGQSSYYYSPALFYVGDQQSRGICQGDSGGPTFHTFSDGVERVVGVHSFTAGEACTLGGVSRTDYYTSFINAWLSQEEGPQCGRDGQCKNGCAPLDPDCVCVADGACSGQCSNPDWDPDCPPNCGQNGICQPMGCPAADVDCVQLGGACANADVCQEKVCTFDQQHPEAYCSRSCQEDGQCPSGMECADGTCKYIQLPEAGFSAVCQDGVNVCGAGLTCNRTDTQADSRCLPSCNSADNCIQGAPCVLGVKGKMCDLPPPAPVLLALAPRALPAAGCTAVGGVPGAGLVLAWALLRRRRRG